MYAHQHLYEDHFGSRGILSVDSTGDDTGIRAPKNLCVTDSLEGLCKVKEPGKNVLVYYWSPTAKLKSMIEKTKFASLPTFSDSIRIADVRFLAQKASDPLLENVFSEFEKIIEAFSKLLTLPALKIELITTQDRTCPLFHVDRVNLRLLCTLRGPGTEWLSDRGVNRKYLGCGDNRKIVRKNALVYEAAPFQILILKGNSYPGNSGAGIVHRSPAVPHSIGGRWLLRVDAG